MENNTREHAEGYTRYFDNNTNEVRAQIVGGYMGGAYFVSFWGYGPMTCFTQRAYQTDAEAVAVAREYAANATTDGRNAIDTRTKKYWNFD